MRNTPIDDHTTALVLTDVHTEARIDSRRLAANMHRDHSDLVELVAKYLADFEQLGKVPFQKGPSTSGQTEKFVLLNEDQAYLLLTYSRNTERVRQLKVKLVKSFSEARRVAIQRGAEYLPGYHDLHDQIHALAGGSPNERFVHMNINKLVNRTAGIDSGQRAGLPLEKQSIVCVAQQVAAQAMRNASDHHAAYRRAQAALQALAAVTFIGGAHG